MEPIAKRLRQSGESALLSASATKKRRRGTASNAEEEDVADRIRRLEAELQQQSDGSSDSDSDSESSSDSDGGEHEEATDGAVVNLSAYASERIEALPSAMLPAVRSSTTLPSAKKKSKRQEQQEENERAAKQALAQLGDALSFPKKVPFACKPCMFIGRDLADFQAHRASEAHLERTQSGAKALHCVLCNKTFTSRSQLDEHRAGKWHQQRAQSKKARHTVRVCYDFARGDCRRGDRCAFEHTQTKAMRSGRVHRRVCDSVARSETCRFGAKCLFSHAAAAQK